MAVRGLGLLLAYSKPSMPSQTSRFGTCAQPTSCFGPGAPAVIQAPAPGRVGPWLSLPPVLLWQKLLFAGSRSQLVQLPPADCMKYRSCADCVLARDPYCAWNANSSRCVAVGGHSG